MEMKATRDAYGHALLELGAEHPRLVVLDADLSRSTRTEWFQQKFPDRFFNLGIAEQNMIGVAAGLAASGLLPFATTYAIFVGRAYDQIREAVCYARTNVKIVATHAGLAASYDGGAHQGIEDIALMRAIPGMTVLSPADYHEAVQAVRAAAVADGPVYIRLQKEPVPVVTPADRPFVIGRATVLRPGTDVAIVATGSLTSRALAAAARLSEEGIEAEVVNASTLKPFDVDAVRRSVERCGCAVTVEEHNRYGGLHEAVLAALAGELLAPVAAVAMPDVFGETGPWEALLEKFGLTESGICAAARAAIAKKRRLDGGVGRDDRAVRTPEATAEPAGGEASPRHLTFAGLGIALHADGGLAAAVARELGPFFACGPEPPVGPPILELHVSDRDAPPDLHAATEAAGEPVVVDTSLYKHLASEGRRWALSDGYLVRIDATGSLFHFAAEPRRAVTLYQPDASRRVLDAVRAVKGFFTPAVERAGGIQIHSSGVVIGGDDAVLLIGDMWQGKTTLLLEMLAEFDVRQLSCDTVVLMPEAGGAPTVFGWPSPFSVSHGTLADHAPLHEFFPEARRDVPYAQLWAEGKKAVLTSHQVVERYRTAIQPAARRVAACLIVRFEPDEPTRIEPLHDGEPLVASLRAMYLGSRDPIYHNWHRYVVCDDAAIEANVRAAADRLLGQAAVYTLTWAPSAVSLMKRVPMLARAHKDLRRLLLTPA